MKATCTCGAVHVQLPAVAPPSVVACHCRDCQTRSGAPFGLGAYYSDEEIEITGETKRFRRTTATGGDFDRFFCVNCGSSVYWKTSKHPGRTGIAVGCIDHPNFPAPVRSVWEQSKFDWVDITPALQHFNQGTPNKAHK